VRFVFDCIVTFTRCKTLMKKLIVFSLVRETCKFIDFESPVSIRLTIRRLVQSRPVSPTKWRGCGHLRAHVPVRRNTISSINFQSATKISNPYYSSYCFSVKISTKSIAWFEKIWKQWKSKVGNFWNWTKKHEVGFPVELLTRKTPIVLLLKLLQLLVSFFC